MAIGSRTLNATLLVPIDRQPDADAVSFRTMAIRPESESKLWDDYPVDDSPLPEQAESEHLTRAFTPVVLAGAMAALLVVAGLLAMTFSGDDSDPAPTPNTLSFESDS